MILRPIVHSILHPLPIFWAMVLLAILLRNKKKRLATFLFMFALVWLALLSTPPLPIWLVSRLENQYPPLTDLSLLASDTAIHILVLGGGHTSDPRLPANNQLSQEALGRLVEGIRLHRQLPGSQMVFSGYSREGIPESHAEVQARTAMILGVDAQCISMLTTPRNTEEEGAAYSAKFGTDYRLILVTSAVHMPRAMLHFCAAGLEPIAAPTNHRIKKDALSKGISFKPSARNLQMMSVLWHEYAGMLHAKMKGRW